MTPAATRPDAWQATVLTLYPDMFPGPLAYSLAGRALDDRIWRLETVNLRDFAVDRHGTVDAMPFGGGAGMVMRPDVVAAALDSLSAPAGERPIVCLTPRGVPLSQDLVADFAAKPELVVLCGRFEGIDQRVIDQRDMIEVSLGDFVLSGGEPAAIALIDACVRLLPGVIGATASLDEESFGNGLLEYPHFTRPREWDGRPVPEVLLSGHHERIRTWRLDQAERLTRQRRPDLWQRYAKRRAAASDTAEAASARIAGEPRFAR